MTKNYGKTNQLYRIDVYRDDRSVMKNILLPKSIYKPSL